MSRLDEQRLERLDLDAEPTAPKGRNPNGFLLLMAGGIPTVLTVLGFLGLLWWPLDLAANFRFQYLVILLVTVVASLVTRRWRLAILFLAPMLLNAAVIGPLYVPTRDVLVYRQNGLKPLPPPPPPPEVQGDAGEEGFVPRWNWPNAPDRRVLKLASVYTDVPERTVDNLLEYLRDLDADVVLLQHVTEPMRERLQFQVAPFKLEIAAPRSDGFGMAMLVRVTMRPKVRLQGARILELTRSGPATPAIAAVIKWDDRFVSILGVHAVAPLGAANARRHDRQLQAVALWAVGQEHPPIVLGNLNTTPWAARFAVLLEKTGLVNSQQGYGMQATWPAGGGFPLGEIPVDHCLHSAELVTVNRMLGPTSGADHRTTLIDLAWTDQLQWEAPAPPRPKPESSSPPAGPVPDETAPAPSASP